MILLKTINKLRKIKMTPAVTSSLTESINALSIDKPSTPKAATNQVCYSESSISSLTSTQQESSSSSSSTSKEQTASSLSLDTVDSDDETPANKNRVFRPFLSPTKEEQSVRGPKQFIFGSKESMKIFEPLSPPKQADAAKETKPCFKESPIGSKEHLLKFFQDNPSFFKSCAIKDRELVQEKFAELVTSNTIDSDGVYLESGFVTFLVASTLICNILKEKYMIAISHAHVGAFWRALEAYVDLIMFPNQDEEDEGKLDY